VRVIAALQIPLYACSEDSVSVVLVKWSLVLGELSLVGRASYQCYLIIRN
jgi:hypothetical protein